jgi:hypothetical protein
MAVLIALAGFVVFLCVFGMRGLKIAGAVLGVVGILFFGELLMESHHPRPGQLEHAEYRAR